MRRLLLDAINAAWNRVAPPDPSPVLPGTTSRWEDEADGYLVEAPGDAYRDAYDWDPVYTPAAELASLRKRLGAAEAKLDRIRELTPMVSDEWPIAGEWVSRSDVLRILDGDA